MLFFLHTFAPLSSSFPSTSAAHRGTMCVHGVVGFLPDGVPSRTNAFSEYISHGPPITYLLYRSGPPTVFRAVSRIVINAVQRMRGTRLPAHVRKELEKPELPLPLRAHANTPLVIPRYLPGVPVCWGTALQHGIPCRVFGCPPTSRALSVLTAHPRTILTKERWSPPNVSGRRQCHLSILGLLVLHQ